MVKAMFSGVSGMRAHQQKMDVIGNNLANVNTYGFKASRATFSEVYYQTTRSASGGGGNRGGINPSQTGYGVQVGSIDVLQTRSGFQMTDNGMDVAIAGEGFFQVQDSEGNTFYTRAGLLRVDSAGNMVDASGNFVLGVSGSGLGQAAGTDKITINVPPVNPKAAELEEKINGNTLKVTASNTTKEGNVSLNFVTDSTLPIGQAAKADITSSGISIKLNPTHSFADINALQQAVNDAVTAANGGKEHPAGVLSISMVDGQGTAITFPRTGKDIASADYSPNLGKVEFPANMFSGVSFKEAGTSFTGAGATTNNTNATMTHGNNPAGYTFTYGSYSGTISSSDATSGTLMLKNTAAGADPNDYIIVNHPGYTSLAAGSPGGAAAPNDYAAVAVTVAAIPTTPSTSLGFGSKQLKLTGGTEGGPQTVSDLTSIGIAADGTINGVHADHGQLQLGRIDIVTFDNPSGLLQEGTTYFSETPNSGQARVVNPGQDGSGNLVAGALEMANVDLSREFSDMITTQRGFQANSKMITVSDEMLEQLVNLKR